MNKEFSDRFAPQCASKTAACCVWQNRSMRLSVLAGRLMRLEVSRRGYFEDRPTQKVWFRDFSRPAVTFEVGDRTVTAKTPHAEFTVDLFLEKVTEIKLSNGTSVTDFKKGNLKGTYRTLDQTAGAVPLEDGLISTGGVTVFDDSESLLIDSDGSIVPAKHHRKDLYYFAYGNDYRACMKDFYNLTGEVPLVPRWCLGNWWSRYRAYTQEEYLKLMRRFKAEEIPITVATVDMDWHWVDVAEKFGRSANDKAMRNLFASSGWTGYSWNMDLFPDYRAFLKELKDEGYKVTLNLHPADGVRWFEDMYEDIAKVLGYNTEKKERVKFKIGDPDFVTAYFKYLHHPYEKEGVDFWWIDWQQGRRSDVKGLDPLWALNHFHYIDNGRDGKRPMILSRYAQIGSHRYPLGFSGDTDVSWGCLKFQPYFTANAANAGYTWWSHDIGGHHRCSKDDELYIRWIQFGVFSPIMRLHSTANEFMGKEPWKYRYDARILATENLRLRHRLIPYIYSMNYRCHKDGIALCEPMYYAHAEKREAYTVPNEYYFGSELIAAPITEATDKETNRAGVRVWLPEGRFTDIFTGNIYKGGRYYTMYRGVESIPVLAKAGAVIPLSADGKNNNWRNPEALEILIYRGNGKFTLYEDDGESNNFKNGAFATTKMKVREIKGSLCFKISASEGDLSVIPEKRDYLLRFKDVAQAEGFECSLQGAEFTVKDGFVTARVSAAANEEFTVTLRNITPAQNTEIREAVSDIISSYQLSVSRKATVYNDFVKNPVGAIPGDEKYKGPIAEVLDMHSGE